MAHKTPFLVADLGPDVEPFLLHLYAALPRLPGTPARLRRVFVFLGLRSPNQSAESAP